MAGRSSLIRKRTADDSLGPCLPVKRSRNDLEYAGLSHAEHEAFLELSQRMDRYEQARGSADRQIGLSFCLSTINQKATLAALRKILASSDWIGTRQVQSWLDQLIEACVQFRLDESHRTPGRVISAILNGLKAIVSGKLVGGDRQRELIRAIRRLTRFVDARYLPFSDDRFSQSVANCLNAMKVFIENGVTDSDERDMRAACGRLVELIRTDAFDRQAGPQAIANSLNALKTFIEKGVVSGDDGAVRAACRHLVDLTRMDAFDRQAEPQAVANSLNALKTFIEKGVVPADDKAVRAACRRLVDLTRTAAFDRQAEPLAVANSLNALKTFIKRDVMPADDRNVRAACRRLVELTCTDAFNRQAEPRAVANSLNALKTLIEKGVVSADDGAVHAACRRLVDLTRMDAFDRRAEPLAIANSLNALKTFIEKGVVSGDDGAVRAACRHLVDLSRTEAFDRQAEPQAVANSLNALKTFVEKGVVSGNDELVRTACRHLVHLTGTAAFGEHADPQAVANSLSALKTLVEKGVVSGNDELMRTACRHLTRLTDTAAFGERADPQAVANSLHALKNLIEKGVVPNNDEAVRAACLRLVDMTRTDAFDQRVKPEEIANSLNALKTLIKKDVVPADDEAVRAACRHLVYLTDTAAFAEHADPQAVANSLNALKTFIEKGVVSSNDEAVRASCRHLVDMTRTDAFDRQAEPLDIANSLNALKTLVEKSVVSADNESVRAACRHLIHLTDTKAFGERAAPQAVANSLNALKTLVEKGAVSGNDAAVHAACHRLVRLIGTAAFGERADPRAVANSLNALKALVEQRVMPDNDEVVHTACRHLIRLTGTAAFGERATPQAVANSLNALKALVDKGVVSGNDEAMHAACRRLVRLTHTEAFGEHADPQAVASSLNALKTLIEKGVVSADDEAVRTACQHLIYLTGTKAFDEQADPQAVANSLTALQVLTEHGCLSREEAHIRAASLHLVGLLGAPRFVTTANSLSVSASLDALAGLISMGILAEHDGRVDDAVKGLLHLGMIGERMLQAGRSSMRRFTQAIGTLQETGTLNEAFLATLSGDFHAQCIRRLDDGEVSAGERACMMALLFHLASHNWLELTPVWQTCNRLWPEEVSICTVDSSTTCLQQGTNWYMRWRRMDAGDSALALLQQQLLERLVRVADRMDWENGFSADDGPALRDACLTLHQLAEAVEGQRGKLSNPLMHTRLETLLRERAIPGLVAWARGRQQPGGFDVTMGEAMLSSRYLPQEAALEPPFRRWTSAQCRQWMSQLYEELNHGLRPMTRSLEMPVVRPDGTRKKWSPDGTLPARPRSVYRDVSIYRQMLPADVPPPLLVQLSGPDVHRVYELPAFIQHEGHWYRSDFLRGSLNKGKDGDYPQWLAIPCAVTPLLARWFPGLQLGCYGARAWLPEPGVVAGAGEIPRLRHTPNLCGIIPVTVISDARAEEAFIPKPPYDALRVKDGCGFIPASLARQLLGDGKYNALVAASGDAVQAGKKGLPMSALFHYSGPEVTRKQIAAGFLEQAKTTLNTPLASMQTKPRVEHLEAAITGGVKGLNLTALPMKTHANGILLILPDTPQMRELASRPLIMGRPPYDTRNLRVVYPEQIEFMAIDAPLIALQYTLNGLFADDPTEADGDFTAMAAKGLVVILPDDAWPAGHPRQLVIGAKDIKLHSSYDSVAAKQKVQGSTQTDYLDLHGALVIKDTRIHCYLSDVKRQDELGGDFDGDVLQFFRGMEALCELIEAQSSRGNPKIAKPLDPNPDGRLFFGEQLAAMLSGLLEHACVLEERYYNLPEAERQTLNQRLAPHHILAVLFGTGEPGDTSWIARACLPENLLTLPAQEQQELIVSRELEVLHKYGTDLEKIGPPPPVVIARLDEILRQMTPWLARRVPWSLNSQPEVAAWLKEHPNATLEETRQLVGTKLRPQLDETVYWESIPTEIARTILSWFLDEVPREPGASAPRKHRRADAPDLLRKQFELMISKARRQHAQGIPVTPPPLPPAQPRLPPPPSERVGSSGGAGHDNRRPGFSGSQIDQTTLPLGYQLKRKRDDSMSDKSVNKSLHSTTKEWYYLHPSSRHTHQGIRDASVPAQWGPFSVTSLRSGDWLLECPGWARTDIIRAYSIPNGRRGRYHEAQYYDTRCGLHTLNNLMMHLTDNDPEVLCSDTELRQVAGDVAMYSTESLVQFSNDKGGNRPRLAAVNGTRQPDGQLSFVDPTGVDCVRAIDRAQGVGLTFAFDRKDGPGWHTVALCRVGDQLFEVIDSLKRDTEYYIADSMHEAIAKYYEQYRYRGTQLDDLSRNTVDIIYP
ncbi:hypothetical protein WT83_04780 [Burkholderia territorii]|uniref:Uncharacterized protein n=1 Tax=Burkholderia territorii TaxID=1503055 RepID=A0A119VNZ6_9BURK|nr:hypothetical protein WT83_04780 [Burkholderia territorii]